MKTVDDEILDWTIKFMDKAKGGQQAVLCLAQPHAHVHRDPPLMKTNLRIGLPSDGTE